MFLYPYNKLLPKGFTLIELLVVLCLLTTLTVLSLPALIHIKQKNHLAQIENELISALQMARNKSISENKLLILMPIASSNWSQGIILKEAGIEDNTKTTLYKWDWSQSKVQISWQGFSNEHALYLSPDLKKAACSGHFLLQYANLPSRKLILNRLGRIRVSTLFEELH